MSKSNNVISIQSTLCPSCLNSHEICYCDEMQDDHNNCDKCKAVELSNDLIWITSEDFEPRENETLPTSAHEEFDALCELCYSSLLII